jgi:uncharacterized membrane protein
VNPNTVLYGLGAILLGAIICWSGDFAMQWQPVPGGFPLRKPLAILSGMLLIAGGFGLLVRRFERQAALLFAVNYAFWTVVLHGAKVLGNPGVLIEWNGIAEIGFLTCGAVALYSSTGPRNAETLRRWARMLAGAFALMFGAVHFHYLDGTASFVPEWIPPNRHFWAAATGAGYLAAGLALVSGVQARLAATLTCFMMGCFVVLLHLPRVIADPELRVEWIMLAVASSLTGGAWLIRRYST